MRNKERIWNYLLFKTEFRTRHSFIWTEDSALRLRNAYAIGIWTEFKNNFNKIE